jgi:hypothetical protein
VLPGDLKGAEIFIFQIFLHTIEDEKVEVVEMSVLARVVDEETGGRDETLALEEKEKIKVDFDIGEMGEASRARIGKGKEAVRPVRLE